MKLIHASKSKILNLNGKRGGSIEIKKTFGNNETATVVNGIVGLSSKPMANDPSKQIKPIGVTGPLSVTGQHQSLLGSGLKSICFNSNNKKENKKVKLKL